MEVETIGSLSQCPNPISKPAFAEGEPLVIDPSFPKTLPEALQRTAKALPHKGIRFINRDRSETFYPYSKLLECAKRGATGLRARGLKPGSKMILQLDSLEAHYQAFWSCLLMGIVPVTIAIAPAYDERNGVVDKLYNTWLLLDKPPIITTERMEDSFRQLNRLLSMTDLKTIHIEEALGSSPSGPFPQPHPSDVAFIQLSSGSTGVPKCIQETHQSVIAHIHSSAAFNEYEIENVTLNWLPVDHVVPLLTFHVKDVYLGCEQIHVPTGLVLSEPLLWLDLLESHQVTHTWAPNFAYKLASERLRMNPRKWDLSRVKFFMNAGEQVTLPVVRDFLQALAPSGVRESAMQPAFGMAEVCTCMTYANQFNLTKGARRFSKSSLNGRLVPASEDSSGTVDFVGLGKVTPGISIRIADADNRVLSEGVIGRLQIKGPVVTPGYFRNDEANHDAFVGNGWFNTGDLGFMWDDELYLTGREKEMIIIRGAKFYCYEVEDVINGVPGVEPTFAAACGITDATTGTEKLAIFFAHTGVTDELALVKAVRKRVTGRLGIAPAHVVPLSIEQFPKTTSGKIQRTRLKKLLESGALKSLQADDPDEIDNVSSQRQKTEIEERLVQIWREVLSVTGVGPDSNLFELGGDSLKAAQIISRVRQQWRLEFPMSLLFADATIAGMARWITENQGIPQNEALPAIQAVPRNSGLPLSYSQVRLWLAEQIDPGTSLYNICRTLRLTGPLDPMVLERALQAMVNHHEIFRTIYSLDDMPVQEILPSIAFTLPRHELTHLPELERKRVVANLVELEASRPFDLATGPMLRAKLVRLGSEEHLLVIVFHQIVTDAWSLKLFFQELARFYEAIGNGNESVSGAVSRVQYADYSVWQQRWFTDGALEGDLEYWVNQLRGLRSDSLTVRSETEPVAFVPHEATVPLSSESVIHELCLQKSFLDKIRAFNAAANVTLHTTLLAAFKLLVHDLTGWTDLAIGSPESGRRRLETENLLGCFVNMLVLRTRLSRDESFRTFLSRVRQTVLGASAHADVPFEKVQATLGEKGKARGPLFRMWFGPIDSLESFRIKDAFAEPEIVFPPMAQFDLSCFISERSDSVTCFFEHKKEVFDTAQGARLMDHYERLISNLIEAPDTPIREILNRAGRNGMSPLQAVKPEVPVAAINAAALTQSIG